MIRESFNQGWTISTVSGFAALFDKTNVPQPVTLPHDAMILKKRDPDTKTGSDNGFYPGGTFTYIKKYFYPESLAGQTVLLEFEGAYMHAMVYVNGDLAGRCPHGYTNFYVDAGRFLRPGAENEIKVVTKSSNDKDSRWYSGGGIYRDVNILIGGPLRIAADGVRVTTPDIEKNLTSVEITTKVEYSGATTRKVWLQTELRDADGLMAGSEKTPLTVFTGESVVIRQKIFVQNPQLWSVDTPSLYTCHVHLVGDGETADTENVTFGIRKLQLDPQNGLRINGETVKLRGGCIHHDNGVIGACAFAQAEERRARILKQSGYNAIRSAHNPVSKAMLDACDRIGLLVMDEVNDTWCQNKTNFDSAMFFADWWEQIIEAMVAKDYNHPSVIFYSVGNEIQEVVTPGGSAFNRQLADKIRSLDSTRYITNGLNIFLALSDRTGEVIAELAAKDPEVAKAAAGGNSATGGDINAMMSMFGMIMDKGASLNIVGDSIAETASALDVVGYNYLEKRYEIDKEQFPNRIVVGSETYISRIDRLWKLVKDNSHVIGDFCWTAWDYLGESGIGRVNYSGARGEGIYAPYPWHIAWCGAIDILGNRRPPSYYQEIVWGLRQDPYIAIQRPEHFGQPFSVTEWSWSDTIASWTWPEYAGKPIQAEVYADADEVELLLNGQTVGRAPAGESNRFKAVFNLTYATGELTAIAWTAGRETGRTTLRTAGDGLRLAVNCDNSQLKAGGAEIAYLMISLTDENEVLQTSKDRKVNVSVNGAGTLQGFGSANPVSTEDYFDSDVTTFDGQVLAVVRAGVDSGDITVRISAEGCEEQVFALAVI